MNIIEILGGFILYYVIPTAIALFLCRKWNLDPRNRRDKIPSWMALIPIAGSLSISLICLFTWIFRNEHVKSFFAYFDGKDQNS